MNERGDAVIEEQNGAASSGENDLFGRKIAAIKRVKSERKTKKRNVMSGIVSGKTITEDAVLEKVREHIEKNPGKSNCNERQSCKSDSVGKIEREKKGVSNVGKKRKGSETERKREDRKVA